MQCKLKILPDAENLLDDLFADEEPRESSFVFPHKAARVRFNKIWDFVFGIKFTNEMYERCLVFIPEKVLPFLNDPVQLTDFFMNAYELGMSSRNSISTIVYCPYPRMASFSDSISC